MTPYTPRGSSFTPREDLALAQAWAVPTRDGTEENANTFWLRVCEVLNESLLRENREDAISRTATATRRRLRIVQRATNKYLAARKLLASRFGSPTTGGDLRGGEESSGGSGSRRGGERGRDDDEVKSATAEPEDDGGRPVGIKRQKMMMKVMKDKASSSSKVVQFLEIISKAVKNAAVLKDSRERHKPVISKLKLLIKLLTESGASSEEIVEERKKLVDIICEGADVRDPKGSPGMFVATSQSHAAVASAVLLPAYAHTPPQIENPGRWHPISDSHPDSGYGANIFQKFPLW